MKILKAIAVVALLILTPSSVLWALYPVIWVRNTLEPVLGWPLVEIPVGLTYFVIVFGMMGLLVAVPHRLPVKRGNNEKNK